MIIINVSSKGILRNAFGRFELEDARGLIMKLDLVLVN